METITRPGTTFNDDPLYDIMINASINDKSNIMFDKIKELSKQYGEMYLFGKPTPRIAMLILAIYHENIFQILSGGEVKAFMLLLEVFACFDLYLFFLKLFTPRVGHLKKRAFLGHMVGKNAYETDVQLSLCFIP
jgi:hypothetical protein